MQEIPEDYLNSGLLPADSSEPAITLHLVSAQTLSAFQEQRSDADQAWLQRQSFTGKSGQIAWLENGDGVVGRSSDNDLSVLGHLPYGLPEGSYRLAEDVGFVALLGWGLGSYRFDRYKTADREPAKLVLPANADAAELLHTIASTNLTRDLINTPAQDMAPSHLQAEVEALADTFGAQITTTVGDDLLNLNCGAIHAVGRAATDEPRLMDMLWGNPEHPKVTIVGKGVTFDSGGLNIKPSGGMRWMKKDMGGAAIALGLAYLIMSQGLPIRLRVLIPAAENAIAGNAFRPGDVLDTHKGLTVEIDNTDAEGRLLLCDALSMASSEQPELIVDYATLTGAARGAVGAEIAALFSNDDALALELTQLGRSEDDAVWPMPLHTGYDYMLNSNIADVVNSAASPYAGAVTAALFLKRFVDEVPWVHFDIMAFNIRKRPGRPEGGEAMALRSVYRYLRQRFGEGDD
ncbi:MAG: leucyl aminopeptidase family protein [Proteobacteria bacterium]|nr:leucyl aminopeptidase family protein [Pseudomonadota bacterium]